MRRWQSNEHEEERSSRPNGVRDAACSLSHKAAAVDNRIAMHYNALRRLLWESN